MCLQVVKELQRIQWGECEEDFNGSMQQITQLHSEESAILMSNTKTVASPLSVA